MDTLRLFSGSYKKINLNAYYFYIPFMRTNRGPFVSAIGKTWHPDHFCCSSCHVSLQNQAFVEENNQLYCEKCYNAHYAPKCAHCNNAIIGVSLFLLFFFIVLCSFFSKKFVRSEILLLWNWFKGQRNLTIDSLGVIFPRKISIS